MRREYRQRLAGRALLGANDVGQGLLEGTFVDVLAAAEQFLQAFNDGRRACDDGGFADDAYGVLRAWSWTSSVWRMRRR